jgi:DNA-binding response OmpR family regulator
MNFGISVSPAPAPASSPAPKEPVKKPSVLSRSSASTASSETKTEESSTPEKAADSNGRQRLPLFSKGAKPAAIPKSQTAADEMGRYLTNAAAMLTEAYVGEDAATISVIRHRVRYSHLLATRLNLPPAQVSRVVVAAWLSALMDKPHIVRQFLCPYNLEEILFSKETDKTKLPPEGRILDLISRYEDLKRQNSAACREVNLMRRNLHLLWSSSQADQPMLETFLQILMDEQFLSKLDRAAGRIVIVDQTGFSTANIVTLLTNDGYDVSSVSTADAAWDSIQKHAADMIICEVSQPQNSGLSLCRRIKGNANTSRIPFLFLVARNEEKRAAECLRAGADDFLVKPVDTEVLFLKMQKLMKVHAADASQVGVNGKLEDMSFTDMIQILSAGAKNMEIHLTRQGHEGRVFLKEGNVIHAATGSLQGDEAFYQLMKWRDGLFTTKPCATFPAATIQASTTSLMMEGARLSDEDGETRE